MAYYVSTILDKWLIWFSFPADICVLLKQYLNPNNLEMHFKQQVFQIFHLDHIPLHFKQ